MRLLALTLLPLLSGCVKTLEGPYVGDCAEYPKGVYTWGEVGIGTCLAGPADVQFVTKDDGSTWLAVSNADPYRNFSGGSVLLIDWSSLDFDLGRNVMSDLNAYALDTEHYMGGLGFLAHRQLLLATSRFSAESRTRTAQDHLRIIDLHGDQPELWQSGESLTLEDDPFHVVVDDDVGRAYVMNLTDHSVSVIDTTTTPLRVFDVADAPRLGEANFFDVDDSGSRAELSSLTIIDEEQLDNEMFTLDWVDGAYRVWMPREGGLQRYHNGGGLDFIPSALGVEFNPTLVGLVSTVNDPFFTVSDETPVMLFDADGSIRVAVNQGTAGSWSLSDNPVVRPGSGGDAVLQSPSLAIVDNAGAIYYDRRQNVDANASIGVAFTEDGDTYNREDDAVLVPPSGESFEDPFVLNDYTAGRLRMWFSRFDGTRWSIVVAESFDGIDWTEAETVIAPPGEHAAAPTVVYGGGRYTMFYAWSDGDSWHTARAWSWDGVEWNDHRVVVDAFDDFDLRRPPRVSLQAAFTSGWAVDGRDSGPNPLVAIAGQSWIGLEAGFAFVPSSGQRANLSVLPAERSRRGLTPSSYLEIDGRPTLYVTGIGEDDRERIGVIQKFGDQWASVRSDVIPAGTGGNNRGAMSPVVFQTGRRQYTMLYAAENNANVAIMRMATSNNGLSFVPTDKRVIRTQDFDNVGQWPHSIEQTADGLRLWYTGSDGSRQRIGAATSDDGGTVWHFEPGPDHSYHLGTGQPGDFDDSGVADPMVVIDDDGTANMYFSGFDGDFWYIGHAIRDNRNRWIRQTDPVTGEALPSMVLQPGTFMSGGARSPVMLPTDDGDYQVFFAGISAGVPRLGEGAGNGALFPHVRFPTVGDRLELATRRGDGRLSVIELRQLVEEFESLGEGVAAMHHDKQRGFLYIASKLDNDLFVVDIRDDSAGTFVDANYLDLEAVVRISSASGLLGFRDIVAPPGSDLLYLTTRAPDGVVAIDLTGVVDDDRKQVHFRQALGAMPMRQANQNEGPVTAAFIGGAGMALAPDDRTLLATHFRGNAVYAFDLEVGHLGEQTHYVPYIGENPHLIRMSPDGMHAVVANYVGELHGFSSSSTLAILDMDPNSPTYLQAITWIVND